MSTFVEAFRNGLVVVDAFVSAAVLVVLGYVVIVLICVVDEHSFVH